MKWPEMISAGKNVEWQLPPASISDQNWDVVIIGAGPAGAIAAVHLAAADHKVLLLDKEQFPREKICGDGLLPSALRCLDTAGLDQGVREHGFVMHQASLFSPSRINVEVPGTYITLKRYLLDTMVARHAVEAGAVFACGNVDQIVVEADESVSFSIKKSEKKYKARIAIVATGAQVGLLKKTGRFAAKPPGGFALRCYVQSAFDLDHMVISVDKDIAPGYAWIFPMGKHEYNMGCCAVHKYVADPPLNLKKVYHNFVNEFPLARKLMQNGAITGPLRGAAMRGAFEGVHPYIKGPIIVTGESIGTTLPFPGDGIGKAMESGELAAEIVHTALASGDLEKLRAYSERLSNDFKPRYRAYQIAQAWIAKPWLADFIFRRAQKSKYLTDMFSGIIAETHTPTDIFSIKGVFKSFWK